MGNHTSCVVPHTKETAIHLIHSDGSVEIIHRSITASEIMQRFPEHLVCHSDSLYLGQKIPALSPKEELKMGQKYFLLPKQSFQSVLSLVSLASFIFPSKSVVPSRIPVRSSLKAPFLKNPFEIEKVEGGLRIRVCAEFISQLMEDARFGGAEERDNGTDERLCNTPQLKKDYAQLVTASKNQIWRPKLDTIMENDKVRRFKINKRHKSC